MQSAGRKLFTWLFVVLVGSVLFFALVVWPNRAGSGQTVASHVNQLKKEVSLRQLSRSVLRGEPRPGNAWDEYNLALKDTATWHDDDNGALFMRFIKGHDASDRARVERLLAEHAPVLDHLRLGAQRSDGQYPYNWDDGARMALPSLLGCQRMASLATAEARMRTEDGQLQDAIDVLLDVSVFGRDLAANGPLLSHLVGLAVYSKAFDELQHALQSGKLTKNQLTDLAKTLMVVDHDFPAPGSSLLTETLGFEIAMSQGPGAQPTEWFGLVRQRGLPFALNPGKVMLEMFEERERYAYRAEELDQMRFADARKEIDAISADVAASPNTMIRGATPDFFKIIVTNREALAHLRLLQAGTILLATGQMPTIADPFGENLLYKQEGKNWKIWSIGSDAANRNGAGRSAGRPGIVFEVSQ
jgi:hypothetical protein